MKTLKTFNELQRVLESLPKDCEAVFANAIICKFQPKTATYNVRLSLTYNCGEYVLTFSNAMSYPCIFVGSNIDACINQAKMHYSVTKKF